MTSASGLALLLDFVIAFVLVTTFLVPLVMVAFHLALLLAGAIGGAIIRRLGLLFGGKNAHRKNLVDRHS